MSKKDYSCLNLSNQLCFPLYAASKEIISKYKPILDEIGLTYTQYITMMVLWEYGTISVRDMGKLLYLDSGTLTPLLKKLEQKGFVERKRDSIDERILNVTVTQSGLLLRDKAVTVPSRMSSKVKLTKKEKDFLCEILKKILDD